MDIESDPDYLATMKEWRKKREKERLERKEAYLKSLEGLEYTKRAIAAAHKLRKRAKDQRRNKGTIDKYRDLTDKQAKELAALRERKAEVEAASAAVETHKAQIKAQYERAAVEAARGAVETIEVPNGLRESCSLSDPLY